MKKIISIILLSTISLGSFAEGIFNMQIPQPDFVSNDWDGDKIPNIDDPDDDNDGVDDVDDSTPFGGRPGASKTTPYVYEGDTCEDGILDDETVTALNYWSSNHNKNPKSYTKTTWCTITTLNIAGRSTYSNGKYYALGNMTYIPDEIGALTSLEILSLQHNKISIIPESIGNLKNLKQIHFELNKIQTLPDSVSGLINLEVFRLQVNHIYEFPSVLLGMSFLDTLHLQSNKMSEVPDAVNGLVNIRGFRLDANPGYPFFNITISH